MATKQGPAATLVNIAHEVKKMQDRLAELEMFARHVANAADGAANKGEKVSPSVLTGMCRSIGVE